ncbi:MAG TPA: cell division protein FtsW [Clostridiales bacterium]|nr:cell division protein FtsW [Clostridiales bacterium]
MGRTAGEVNKNRERSYYDYSLLFLTLFLVCFGLIMIYSTSSYNALRKYGDAKHYFNRQALLSGLGILIMLFVSRMDYRLLFKKIPIIRFRTATVLYFVCILLQTYVIVFGEERYGAKRWLEIGPLSFQPSELTKIAVILFTAFIINLHRERLDKFTGFLRVSFFIAPLIGLVIVEDFSTGLVLVVVMVSMCFVASKKKAYFIISGLLILGLGVGFILLASFRSSRVLAWINVESDPLGYQILQGLYAIASGGVFGKGLGESMQKLGFIPESHNDMIFSVICEELGLFGAVSLILIFILLIWRIFVIAINAKDLYGGLIAAGILSHIAVQVLINIAVVTNSIPSTGIPLPFISYGGTSAVVLLIEIGIVLSISNQIKISRPM